MTRKRRQTGVINVIVITPKGNIVGYVNGKPYNGLSMFTQPRVQKWLELLTQQVVIFYNIIHLKKVWVREDLQGQMWVRLWRVLRSIQDLIKESVTTSTNDMNTYSDPIVWASNDTPSH